MGKWVPSRTALRFWPGIAGLLVCTSFAASQQTVQDGATIHVYTNLLQIPVLVLNSRHQPVPPIPPDKFLLHIDKVPPFRPRVRTEGEDPITLAVLIDGAVDGPNLPGLDEALGLMVRQGLRRQDRLTIYGFDGCKLRRTLGLSHTSAAVAADSAKVLTSMPPFQHHWHGEKCASPVSLWDAVAWVSQSMHEETGRRVLLVITNGNDAGSKLSPDEAKLTATMNGVAVFAVTERYKVRADSSFRGSVPWDRDGSAIAFVAEGTGGMMIPTSQKDVSETLVHFPEMLRGRYIVEFSRPTGMTAGSHFLSVTVDQPKLFIRNAGTSMPVADPVAADPTVKHGRLGEVDTTAADEGGAGPPQPSTGQVPAPAIAAPSVATVQATPAAKSAALGQPQAPKPAYDPTDITNEAQPVGTPPVAP